MSTALEQKQISDWFDQTYSARGASYLRPLKAYSIFLELLHTQPGQKLLDAACGIGHLLRASKDHGCRGYGFDISEVAIKMARKDLDDTTLVIANAENIPFDREQFDIITCLGSLERMIDLKKVLAELHRVGKHNAQYCFLVRNAHSLKWQIKRSLRIQNKRGHQGARSLVEWTSIFQENGFFICNVLPDQYPLHRFRKLCSLGLAKIDYTKVEKGRLPLRYANEFIFILKKTRDAHRSNETPI